MAAIDSRPPAHLIDPATGLVDRSGDALTIARAWRADRDLGGRDAHRLHLVFDYARRPVPAEIRAAFGLGLGGDWRDVLAAIEAEAEALKPRKPETEPVYIGDDPEAEAAFYAKCGARR